MSEAPLSLDWNLLLVAASPEGSERTLQYLTGAISACGGWVLHKHDGGQGCAEIDFEFPRAACVEIYSVMVACGLTLSREAHLQLTELCHCTRYLLGSKADDIVRLHLTMYTGMGEGLGELQTTEESREAA